jgi:hypothetical protein
LVVHDVCVPFRWDVSQRPQLGQLLDDVLPESYGDFHDDLLSCMVRVLAASDDGDPFFVGRSPATLLDALSGALRATSWRNRVRVLHFSMYDRDTADVARTYPGALEGIHAYFSQYNLAPPSLTRRGRPAVFVDLVCSGGTFRHLLDLLCSWCEDEEYDWQIVRRHVRLVAIVRERSPLARRRRMSWQDCSTGHLTWSPLLPRALSRQVRVPERLWEYLGNLQPKASVSYQPDCWGKLLDTAPLRDERALGALREARAIFEWGASSATRNAVARGMAQQPAMRVGWFRSLALELKRPGLRAPARRRRGWMASHRHGSPCRVF